MSAADGTILGLTKIFDAGTPSTRWNLVIVSDGYQAGQMAQFATDAASVRNRLFQEPPFDRPELTCAINVYRLDVTSTDAGADKPDCVGGGGSGSTAATFFDSTFCADGSTQRLLYGDAAAVIDAVETLLPQWHQIMVLVNDTERGGGGGNVSWFSNGGGDYREVAIHEMGHSAFGLADEYDYGGPDQWPGGEPGEPNVSAEADPALVKWSALVTAGPAKPTQVNAMCSPGNPIPAVVPAGTVGTFEGANYSPCSVYRPVSDCMMRNTAAAFCPVCTRAIVAKLSPFAQPAPGGDVALGTSTVDFNDVPAGLTVVRAARFDVDSCLGITIHAITSLAAPFTFETSEVVVMDRSGPAPWRGFFWFRFTAGALGPVPPQQVTLRCIETDENFVVTLTANVVARPSVATQLVFDRSGSMLDLTDEGRSKEQVLKDSATVFADLLWDDNGIGINAYDQDPHPIMDVMVAGAPGGGAGRDAAHAAIAAHASNPAGLTAIGDGIELARAKLDAAGTWDRRAMVVLTDGIETASKRVAEVADGIVNQQVFAIGLGTAEQIRPATLDALTSATGGYLLMTGNISADETFLLEKYYLQILAGVNNNDVVLDPEGWVRADAVERIPFDVTEADVEISAIVLGRPARFLLMALEAPDGTRIAMGNASLIGRTSDRALYMRTGLPLLEDGRPHQSGRWHLLLTIDPEFWRKFGTAASASSSLDRGIRYSASVTAYSGLRMTAAVHRSGGSPGATMTVRAILSEYGSPFRGTAVVAAELVRPDGSQSLMPLGEVPGEPGIFEADLEAAQTGIYRFRILAAGRTRREQRFTREAIRTAAFWRGGDLPERGSDPSGEQDDRAPDWCALLDCLVHDVIDERLAKRLLELGFDLQHLKACLAKNCSTSGGRDRPLSKADALAEMKTIIEKLAT